jgi:hypothetical protein
MFRSIYQYTVYVIDKYNLSFCKSKRKLKSYIVIEKKNEIN